MQVNMYMRKQYLFAKQYQRTNWLQLLLLKSEYNANRNNAQLPIYMDCRSKSRFRWELESVNLQKKNV